MRVFRNTRIGSIDIFRSLQSFGRELERPRNDERDWESDRNGYDHQPHNPIGNFQEWKDLRRNLIESQPTIA
jgi:hypothetical protein